MTTLQSNREAEQLWSEDERPLSRILVLGAYGLIGSACVTALQRRGFEVIGMGRSTWSAQRAHPDIRWFFADIADLSTLEWRGYLQSVDAVVNAAGALQEGLRDNLRGIHETAVANLCAAIEGSTRKLVHISAAGAAEDASTEFLRSKARGDARIQASAADWTILRPTLVIGANAYGGTGLLRGAAGLPGVQLRVLEASQIQTIGLSELADAVADCVDGTMPTRQVFDLAEPDLRSLGETLSMFRQWLGVGSGAVRITIPRLALQPIEWVANGLGWLGWRSPLRSTAIRTLAEGVTGDPSGWRKAGGRDFSPLPQTLAEIPATLQERWFARLYLMMPIAIATLSLFWLVSGLVGVCRFSDAVEVLTSRGFGAPLAQLLVGAGSMADIVLGTLILYRRWARPACLAMALLSLGYMAAAAVFTVDLWADPLGPMVKAIPSVTLALLAHAMLEDR